MLTAFELGGDFHSRTALGMYDHIKADVAAGGCVLERGAGHDPAIPELKDKYGSERRKAKVGVICVGGGGYRGVWVDFYRGIWGEGYGVGAAGRQNKQGGPHVYTCMLCHADKPLFNLVHAVAYRGPSRTHPLLFPTTSLILPHPPPPSHTRHTPAQILNFSIAYGKTAHGLAKDWGVSHKEAEDTVDKWYSDRPEVRQWQADQRTYARRRGERNEGWLTPEQLEAATAYTRSSSCSSSGGGGSGSSSSSGMVGGPVVGAAMATTTTTSSSSSVVGPGGYQGQDEAPAAVAYALPRWGYVTTMTGRRRNLGNAATKLGLFSEDRKLVARHERMAINTPIQGSAADIAALAMLAIDRDPWLKANGWRLLLQVRARAGGWRLWGTVGHRGGLLHAVGWEWGLGGAGAGGGLGRDCAPYLNSPSPPPPPFFTLLTPPAAAGAAPPPPWPGA
jgi:hypothetical protein